MTHLVRNRANVLTYLFVLRQTAEHVLFPTEIMYGLPAFATAVSNKIVLHNANRQNFCHYMFGVLGVDSSR